MPVRDDVELLTTLKEWQDEEYGVDNMQYGIVIPLNPVILSEFAYFAGLALLMGLSSILESEETDMSVLDKFHFGENDRDATDNEEVKIPDVFPETPKEMDEYLGQKGKSIPDGPATPGRDKVKWELPDGTTVTYEGHPYHKDAPSYHKDPHWHVDTPGGAQHQRYIPGDSIPFSK